jgi:1-acyl-sn-glycerol-3-phosphate acyltransferase
MSVEVTFGPAGPLPPIGTPERVARCLAWFLALGVLSLWCEVVGHVWCLWPTRRGSPRRVERSNWIVRVWGRSLFRLTTSWLKAGMVRHGVIPPGRYVVVSNHQSTADIAILIATLEGLECKFVAKRQLGWGIPSVSTALARMGGVLISRQPSRRDVEKLRRMGASLQAWNGSAVVFAEGTRSRDGRVLPYRTGALRLVGLEAGLPLLPVALDGTHAAADLPGFVRRMVGARVSMWIGEPIPYEVWSSRPEEILEEIRGWTVEKIESGRVEGLVPPPPGWSPQLVPKEG